MQELFLSCRISQRLSGPGQTATFVGTEKRLLWKIKKIYGKSEVSGNFKVWINFFSSKSVEVVYVVSKAFYFFTCTIFITARRGSYAKVKFSVMSVYMFRGSGVPVQVPSLLPIQGPTPLYGATLCAGHCPSRPPDI